MQEEDEAMEELLRGGGRGESGFVRWMKWNNDADHVILTNRRSRPSSDWATLDIAFCIRSHLA